MSEQSSMPLKQEQRNTIAIVSTVVIILILVIGFAIMNSRFQVSAAYVCQDFNAAENSCDETSDVLKEGNYLVFDVRNFECRDGNAQLLQKFTLIDSSGEESLNWEIGYNNVCDKNNHVGKYQLTEDNLADLDGDEITVRYTAMDVNTSREIVVEKEYGIEK